jgi:hypothetical protein
MDTNLVDLAGTVVAVVLTLMVFSYLLGDNVLYRLAEHIFVGVAIGYAVVVAFHAILASKLFSPMVKAIGEGDWQQLLLLAIPLVLGLLLLLKPLRPTRWLGNLSLAYLLGVGAALAISGALLGSLLPQVNATADVTHYTTRWGTALGLLSGIVVLIGTIGVLIHFPFGAGQESGLSRLRDILVKSWGGVGRWFILIAFSAILATTFVSRLSLLIGRIQFLLDSVRGLLGG